ncbi:MarR family transcriptional regulator [Streptomyces sp. NPDC026672]|uniref:MarR family winged helix-turn-helix transcriptional regulator n=1 Tax=unclassified Streptomyces TaxID=2593676 RepID=UPI003409291F
MSEQEARPAESASALVGLSFLAVAHRVRETVDRDMNAAGLSLSRAKVLRLLAERGDVHQAELAGALGQAPRSVTQAVEALERLGLVTRTADPQDRRRKTVALTDRGRAALTAGERAGMRSLQRLFGTLDARELAGLDALLGRVDPGAADRTG